jgi:hypothetical protein
MMENDDEGYTRVSAFCPSDRYHVGRAFLVCVRIGQ